MGKGLKPRPLAMMRELTVFSAKKRKKKVKLEFEFIQNIMNQDNCFLIFTFS